MAIKIEIKIENIENQVELLSSYLGAKRTPGSSDWDRLRLLPKLDTELIVNFMKEGVALLGAEGGNPVAGIVSSSDSVSLLIDGKCHISEEMVEMVTEMTRSYVTLHCAARWYAKFGIAEASVAETRSEKMREGIAAILKRATAAARRAPNHSPRPRPLPYL